MVYKPLAKRVQQPATTTLIISSRSAFEPPDIENPVVFHLYPLSGRDGEMEYPSASKGSCRRFDSYQGSNQWVQASPPPLRHFSLKSAEKNLVVKSLLDLSLSQLAAP
ncbi:putative protein isoform X1 [Capsicum annuum]